MRIIHEISIEPSQPASDRGDFFREYLLKLVEVLGPVIPQLLAPQPRRTGCPDLDGIPAVKLDSTVTPYNPPFDPMELKWLHRRATVHATWVSDPQEKDTLLALRNALDYVGTLLDLKLNVELPMVEPPLPPEVQDALGTAPDQPPPGASV